MVKIKDFFKSYWQEILVGLTLLLFAVVGLFYQKDKPLELPKEENTKVWRDKDNKEHYKTDVVSANSPKDFIKSDPRDEELKELRDKVEFYRKQLKNKGNVSNIKTVTTLNKTVETVIKDTVYVDSLGRQFPTYVNHIHDPWIDGKIETNKDSAKIDIKIKNNYSVVIGEDKTGFLGLGKPKTFAEVVNHNPYTETKSLKVYVTDKPKRKPIWLYTLGIGILGGYFIAK